MVGKRKGKEKEGREKDGGRGRWGGREKEEKRETQGWRGIGGGKERGWLRGKNCFHKSFKSVVTSRIVKNFTFAALLRNVNPF